MTFFATVTHDLYSATLFAIFMSRSELVFLGLGIVVLIITTGLFNYVRLLLARQFVYFSLCIVGWFLIILYSNNKLTLSLLQQAAVKVFFVYCLIFLLVLYSYYKEKYLRTGVDFVLSIMLSVLGMTFLFYTQNLLLWFMAIELFSAAFYALAAYRTNRAFLQSEAGLKYFFFGSIASSLYLYGLSILYFLTGKLELKHIATYLYFETNSYYLINIAAFLMLISLLFKLGIAPFHLWAPQVYTSSSVIVAYFLQLLPKIPLVYILYMLMNFNMRPIIYVGVISSVFIGSIYAFYFTPIKTFIAYSGIANNAFIIAPLLEHTTFAFISSLSFLFVYNAALTVFFVCVLFVRRLNNAPALNNLRDLVILKKSNPALAIAMAVVFLNFAGIPPLAGFFSKIMILTSTLSFGDFTLNLILLTGSILSIYYYIRNIKAMYFSSELYYAGLSSIPILPASILALALYVNLASIFFPTLYFDTFLWFPIDLSAYEDTEIVMQEKFYNRCFYK